MKFIRRGLAAAFVLVFASVASAQDAGNCILAGRLADDGHWAPRFEGVELLGADGRRVLGGGKAALGQVKQVRLAQPALLSRCNGETPLARADDEPVMPKSATPALSAGLVDVESVAFPKLRTGGELVELKVRASSDRIVMLTR
jgi:hypothetical protein